MEKNSKFSAWFKKYGYLLWGLYLPVYLISFFIVEKLVPESVQWFDTATAIDSYIPFCEWMVFPYVLWFPFMGAVGLYTALTDKNAFRRMAMFMIISFGTCIILFPIFPNGQSLRPDLAALGRSNIATWLVNRLYSADTCTNVFPSIHVVGSFMAFFGIADTKLGRNKVIYYSSLLLTLIITASTCYVKQHAFIDILSGLIWTFICYIIVYVVIRKIMIKKNIG
ncbi:MAG: phosphatase PAP2 family protein [Clostridia bacterium]|nr:phosphatase PAP2 family protein [Clostridia bacterium]